jgi:hypothetical protein
LHGSSGILFEWTSASAETTGRYWKSILQTTRVPSKSVLSRLRLCTSSQKPVLENMRHLHMRHLHMRLVSEFGIPKIPHSDGYKVGQWVHESPILRHPNTLLRSLTGGFSRSALQRRVRGIGRGGRKF